MLTQNLITVSSPIWTREFAQKVDRISAEKFHIDPFILMEAAGRGVAETALKMGAKERPVIILSGPGNNGGDALVASRYLVDWDCEVYHFMVAEDESKVSEMCKAQLKTLVALGYDINSYEEGVSEEFTGMAPLIVDGIFGIGFKGTLKEDHPAYLALNEFDKLDDIATLAVDLPSGLDIDIAEAQTVPLEADVTVTFGGFKAAHIIAPARDLCGEVLNLDIGFPFAASMEAMQNNPPPIWQIDTDSLLTLNPWNELGMSTHKYERGHVLVIGGSPGKTGATILAATAALRTGAGWATVAMPDDAFTTLRGDVPPEITFEPLFKNGKLDATLLDAFITERKVVSVVIGPGCMENPLTDETLKVLKTFADERDGFIVIDAGATIGILDLLKTADFDSDRVIITPHPGEWKRLTKNMASPLTPTGLTKVKELVEDAGVTIMHKGATPLVIANDSRVPCFINNDGSAILSRAGTGDVLAGIIAAHGAIGFDAVQGSLRSYSLMAMSSELAADALGYHSVLATDIIDRLGICLETEEE